MKRRKNILTKKGIYALLLTTALFMEMNTVCMPLGVVFAEEPVEDSVDENTEVMNLL